MSVYLTCGLSVWYV